MAETRPRAIGDVSAVYRTQLRLLRKWSGGWTGLAIRDAGVLGVSVVALLLTTRLVRGVALRGAASAIVTAGALVAVTAVARPALFAFGGASILLVGGAVLGLRALALGALSRAGLVAIGGAGALVAAVVVYSVANTILAAAIVLGHDEAFFGTLVRELAARYRGARRGGVGVAFIQIDGLARPVLIEALAAGTMPHLARRIDSGELALDAWEALLPSQTSASQAGLLHGTNDEIPAFRWWSKAERRLLVSNHPEDAHEMERRVSRGDGLLAHDGASIGNLLSGDAARSFLTAATIHGVAGEARRSHVVDWFFLTPYAIVRWIALSIGEIAKEVVQARREREAGIEPRGIRGFPYPLARAATNVLLRHLTAALVVEELYRGARVIFADFVDYDEIAHHSGVARVEARDALSGLDRILALLAKAAEDAPRAYRFVVLSDHGQSPGASFRQRYGKRLDEVVRELMGEGASVHGAAGPAERGGRLSRLLAQMPHVGRIVGPVAHGRSRAAAGHWTGDELPDVVVAASGNLAHVSLPGLPGRVSREAIAARYPGLIESLLRHPGIGLVMVRSDEQGTVVLGKDGVHHLADGRVDGTDPLAPYGPHARHGLRHVDRMKDCGDLVVVSRFDPRSGEVASFEEQVGSHGGLGGAQVEAFIAHPAEWRLEGPIVGAPALHRAVRRWIGDS